MEAIKKLKQAGIDPVELAKMINTQHLIVDVLDGITNDINNTLKSAGLSKYKDKENLNKIIFNTKKFIAETDKTLGETAEGFGIMSDELREVVEAFINKSLDKKDDSTGEN